LLKLYSDVILKVFLMKTTILNRKHYKPKSVMQIIEHHFVKSMLILRGFWVNEQWWCIRYIFWVYVVSTRCIVGYEPFPFDALAILKGHWGWNFEVYIPQLKCSLNKIVMCTFQSSCFLHNSISHKWISQ